MARKYKPNSLGRKLPERLNALGYTNYPLWGVPLGSWEPTTPRNVVVAAEATPRSEFDVSARPLNTATGNPSLFGGPPEYAHYPTTSSPTAVYAEGLLSQPQSESTPVRLQAGTGVTTLTAPSGSSNTTRLQSPFHAGSTLPYYPLDQTRPLSHMSSAFDSTSAYDHNAYLTLPRTLHTPQAPPAQNIELSQEMPRFSSSLTDPIPLPAVQSSVAHGDPHIPHPPVTNTGFDTFCMSTPIWTSAVQIEPRAQLYESDIVSCRVDVPSTPQVDPFASLRTLPDEAYINGIQHDAPGFGQNTASHSALGLNLGAPSLISTFAVDHTAAGPPSALRLDLGSFSDGWTSSGDELSAGWLWEPVVYETSVYDHSYITSDLSIPALPSSPPAIMGSYIELGQGAPTGYTPPVTPVLQPVLDGLSLDEGDDPWFLSREQANDGREDESTRVVYGLQTSLTDP